MVSGRDFTVAEEQAPNAAPVAIIDTVLAKQLFAGEDPVGQAIRFTPREGSAYKDDNVLLQIVGVAPTMREELMDQGEDAHIYLPTGSNYRAAMTVHVKAASSTPQAMSAAIETIRRELRQIDPRLPVLELTTFQRFHDNSLELWAIRTSGRMLLLVGTLALGLATAGVYGVKSYLMSRRTREIGIRMALGAGSGDVLGMVMRESLGLTLAGLAVGLPIALLMGRLLATILYDVSSFDPLVFVLSPLVLTAASLFASYIPARRATRVIHSRRCVRTERAARAVGRLQSGQCSRLPRTLLHTLRRLSRRPTMRSSASRSTVSSSPGIARRSDCLGFPADEAIGRHISLIIPKDRLDEENFVIGRIRAGLSVEHYETIRQRKDGSLVDISLTVSPIHAADGTIVGASKIARDISQQKQLQRIADQANRSKDNFLATLSHELRTPLNTVLGYVQMLRKGSLSAEQQAKAIDVISRNTTALGRLVDDVLDTSRIVTGKMRVELQPCEIAPLVEDAIATIRPAADSKGVAVTSQLEAGLMALCDTGRLGQILWNLLTNAVKFTPPGGSMSVTARRRGDNVSIVVEDTGAGITAHDLPLVFQRFWQGEGGRQMASGLGLGLALTRHLVEMHGGSISAASDGPGLGAKFEVLLPSHPLNS